MAFTTGLSTGLVVKEKNVAQKNLKGAKHANLTSIKETIIEVKKGALVYLILAVKEKL